MFISPYTGNIQYFFLKLILSNLQKIFKKQYLSGISKAFSLRKSSLRKSGVTPATSMNNVENHVVEKTQWLASWFTFVKHPGVKQSYSVFSL